MGWLPLGTGRGVKPRHTPGYLSKTLCTRGSGRTSPAAYLPRLQVGGRRRVSPSPRGALGSGTRFLDGAGASGPESRDCLRQTLLSLRSQRDRWAEEQAES